MAVGERLYGYWPMASDAVLQPHKASAAGFADGAAHRAGLHAVYNHYLRCSADPFYRPETEDLQALLRPLFITSWLIDDFLADQGFYGAGTLLLSSASSKTAYGTAFQLAQRAGVQVVGLTSQANQAFCESLGCYHRVVAYEDLEQLGIQGVALRRQQGIEAGDRRVDEKKVDALVGKTGRADADFVKAKTGFTIGGVSPVAHANKPVTLIDRDLFRFDVIWAAAGHPNGVFQLAPQDLEKLTGAPVADVVKEIEQA